MSELKPCPNCKSPKPWIVRIHPLRWIFTKYYIECRFCHYCGETRIGKRRAIKAWNRRDLFNIPVVPHSGSGVVAAGDLIHRQGDGELVCEISPHIVGDGELVCEISPHIVGDGEAYARETI